MWFGLTLQNETQLNAPLFGATVTVSLDVGERDAAPFAEEQ
jgi:hypothetical protein